MSRPPVDVPAAHSMDSCWFAIDQDGEVGLFETGEDGALPEDVATGSGSADANFDELALHGFLAARLHAAGVEQPSCDLNEGGRPVILVDDIEPWHAVKQSGDMLTLLWGPPHALMPARRLDKALIARIQDLPRVGVLDVDQVQEMLFEEDTVPSLGLHSFVADDWGNPGAYGRIGAAERPVRVEELPHAIQQDVQKLKIRTRFAESERLHLADHPEVGYCHTWSETDLRGNPKPGARPRQGGGGSSRGLWIVLLLLGLGVIWFILS